VLLVKNYFVISVAYMSCDLHEIKFYHILFILAALSFLPVNFKKNFFISTNLQSKYISSSEISIFLFCQKFSLLYNLNCVCIL